MIFYDEFFACSSDRTGVGVGTCERSALASILRVSRCLLIELGAAYASYCHSFVIGVHTSLFRSESS